MEQTHRHYDDITHYMPMPAVSFEGAKEGPAPTEGIELLPLHSFPEVRHFTPERI